jgi:hypothetical protein
MRARANCIAVLLALWLCRCGVSAAGTPLVGRDESMTQKNQEVISAQVILRSASGKSLDPQTPITSSNISEYIPSATTVAAARSAFTNAGFDVGNVVGNSMSITAPVITFESFFKTQVRHEQGKGMVATVNGMASQELPVRNVPSELVNLVEAVTFTPPPDFGPTNW